MKIVNAGQTLLLVIDDGPDAASGQRQDETVGKAFQAGSCAGQEGAARS
jgi:hypothetical protein